MEIHELNTKALTDPGYVAVDDGTDTYKADLNNLLTQNLGAAETYAENYADSAISTAYASLSALISANTSDITALKTNPKIWYGSSDTAASTDEKVFSIANYAPKEGDYLVARLRYGNTNTLMQFAINSEATSKPNFADLTDAPDIDEYSLLLFHIRTLSGGGITYYVYDYVGMASSGGGGGGGTSSYSDLTNKPQINSVTLSGNKSFTDLGIDTYIDTYIAANYEDGDSATY